MKRAKVNYISPIEMNKHLKYCKASRKVIIGNWDKTTSLGLKAYIEDCEVRFTLIYKYGSKTRIYCCYKDGRELKQVITGVEAYRIMCMYYRPPVRMCGFSASPFLWKNDQFEGVWNKDAICYDLNSAYAWAMKQPIPDTRYPPKQKHVEAGEIGFDLDGNIIFSGYSLYVFKMIDSPFNRFVDTWYQKKRDPKLREKAKNVLVYSVGYLQLKNPYLRATIVGRCNMLIQSLIDKNTLYCNTDSLVSLVPRPDLILGDNVGEWKVEHKGEFAYRGFNHQWKHDTIAYRHVPKTWFDSDWDITKDNLPTDGNTYRFNAAKCKLELRSFKNI